MHTHFPSPLDADCQEVHLAGQGQGTLDKRPVCLQNIDILEENLRAHLLQLIRKKAQTEEVDYLFLMECLATYKQPRAKLTSLLRSGDIVRVKKGIYLLGQELRRRPYSLEVLANLIYGPSYVSFEYALSYYNLIPEAVKRVTSATCKRRRHYRTPVGEFVYHYIHQSKYATGISWESVDEKTHFFIATREKALADLLARLSLFADREDLRVYLIEGMRIEVEDLNNLDSALLKQIADVYKNQNVSFLCQILKK